MKLIACCKVVPDEQDITINADRSLSVDNAGLKISLYDLNALEAAADIVRERAGSTLTALSVGGKTRLENSKIRKDILSRGPDDLVLVADDACRDLLPAETAKLLAQAAWKIGFDLIICGEGSGDLYAQQTGLLVGERLGVPCINAVSNITLGDGVITVERELEDEVEVLEITLPAVISVTSDINTPRLPAMKAILAASKKPVTQWSLAEAGGGVERAAAACVSIQAPEQTDRLRAIIEGDSEADIAALAHNIQQALH
ncbi:electron transfer flavoprotein [Brenneria tiliae]|uniref:Protein FixA n=1 Tax=Brenneria tiliae TaxID=2914984 RepID=A0ABT0MWJ2_9GAMM|nr:electron transfer flavoprotein [Brenneria tiliae]MCL2893972.1 electron transfer flavoprotein [Brenneria tiliae]